MITVFVTVTVISVALFMFLDNELEAEFRAKTQAEETLGESLIQARLDEVRARLKELAEDNIVRINLTLKVSPQLMERLYGLYPSSDDVRFYVRERAEGTFFPEAPTYVVEDLLDRLGPLGVRQEMVEPRASGGPVFVLAYPVFDKTDVLATAFAVYFLKSDVALMNHLDQVGDGEFCYQAGSSVVSLGGASEKIELPSEAHSMDSKSYTKFRFMGVPGLISKSELPGRIYYFQPLQSLVDVRTRIYTLIGLLSLVFLILSFMVAMPLVRKFSAPLQDMADQALTISHGAGSAGFVAGEHVFSEFEQLSRTFNTMLHRLRDAEEKGRYKELFGSVSDTVCITDMDGNILETNEIPAPLRACFPEGVPRRPIWEVLRLKDREKVLTQIQTQGEATFRGLPLCPDGSLLALEVKAREVAYQGKDGILMVARDMSDWEKAMRSILMSEQKYRALFQTVATPVVIVEGDGTISLANDEFLLLCGASRDDVEGLKTIHDLFPQDVWHDLARDFALLEDGKEELRKHAEMSLVRPDGDVRSVEVRIRRMQGAGQYLMVLQDLTERKWLEAQVIQSEKLAAVGQLVSGVAHELNNPLTSVVGYAELMQKEALPPKVARYLETQRNECNRAVAIVNNLLTFARKHRPEKRMTQINEVLDRTIQLRSYDFKLKNIEVILDPDPALPPTLADYSQLQQVFLNIVNNAEYAMRTNPAQKTLRVSTELSPDGAHIDVRISDDGCGISEEIIHKIFDPFMTTHPVGEGTGLGLSISYGIVQEHQGEILVESAVGKGTTFTVRLPVLSVEAAVEEPDQGSVPHPSGQRKRILVIDDELSILELMEELLGMEGHEVLTSQNPIEGLKILETQEVDLIISDMRMPEMDGKAFLKRIELEHPHMLDHFVFTTGDVLGGETNLFLESAREIPCLYKPFQMRDLHKLLQRML
jgi:PAS domain S-box-containing protein